MADWDVVSTSPLATQTAASAAPAQNDWDVVSHDPINPQWKDLPGNILPSAGRIVQGLAGAIAHPIDTATSLGKGIADTTYGLASKVAAPVIGAINSARGMDPQRAAIEAEYQKARAAHDERTADTVGAGLKDRYGSLDAIKRTLITDPVGSALDVSTILSGGAALPGRIGTTVGKVGSVIDPLTNAGRVVAGAGKATGKGASILFGNTTGQAASPVKLAARAGFEGNDAFAPQMRKAADPNQPVALMNSALRQMREERSAAYNTGMTNVRNDATHLDFQPVNDALTDAQKKVMYGGLPQSSEALKTWKDLEDVVAKRQFQPQAPGAMGPTGSPHYTPEGFDKMKQAVGEIRAKTDAGTLSRNITDDVYQAIKDQVVAQAPEYAKTMSDYQKASDQLNDITKTFSATDKASKDTKLRKLQSIMRNDVSSNYGARTKLGDVLAKYEPDLPFALAGQSMSSAMPRGLAKLYGGAGGLTAVKGALALNPAALAGAAGMLAATSPRLVGETALLGGKAGAQLARVPYRKSILFLNAGRVPGLLEQ